VNDAEEGGGGTNIDKEAQRERKFGRKKEIKKSERCGSQKSVKQSVLAKGIESMMGHIRERQLRTRFKEGSAECDTSMTKKGGKWCERFQRERTLWSGQPAKRESTHRPDVWGLGALRPHYRNFGSRAQRGNQKIKEGRLRRDCLSTVRKGPIIKKTMKGVGHRPRKAVRWRFAI